MLFTAGLLGAHVARRAEDEADAGDLRAALECAGDTKIGEHGASGLPIEQHVLRLHVAVHYTSGMGVVERHPQIVQNGDSVGFTECAFAGQPLTQALTGHELHDEVQEPVHLTGGIHGDDVRMPQTGHRARLQHEALAEFRARRHVGRHHLDGYRPVERFVMRPEDRAHSALSQQSFHAVLAREGDTKSGLDVLGGRVAHSGNLGQGSTKLHETLPSNRLFTSGALVWSPG